jgi:hypothetical protein
MELASIYSQKILFHPDIYVYHDTYSQRIGLILILGEAQRSHTNLEVHFPSYVSNLINKYSRSQQLSW